MAKNPTKAQIKKAFDMEARDRMITHMYFGLKLSQSQIASKVGLSQKTVSVILSQIEEDWKIELPADEVNKAVRETITQINALITEATRNYLEEGKPATLKEITNLMERKSKMMGTDAPSKTAFTTPTGNEEAQNMPLLTIIKDSGTK
jgi:predicted transcriptional regulator